MKYAHIIFEALIIAALAAILILAFWVLPAQAGEPMIYNMVTLPCTETKILEDDLAKTYKEVPTGFGLNAKSYLIRLFQSEKTFTIVSTNPNGMSCVLSSGDEWQSNKPPVAGDKT